MFAKTQFGIVFFYKNEGSRILGGQLVQWLQAKKISFALEENSRLALEDNSVSYLPMSQLAESCRFILVIGGDGSLLRAARGCAGTEAVLFGVHKGTVGFMSQFDELNLFSGLETILADQYQVEERLMLKAAVWRGGREHTVFYGLNEVVLKVGLLSRIVNFRLLVNDTFVHDYSGDGMVVCTPTGSTGFSLSNGGPIVRPDFELFIMSPICPRTFNARPILFRANDILQIVPQREVSYVDYHVYLTIDGQEGFPLEDGDKVLVTASPYRARLGVVYQRDFFDLIRRKIG